jgi:hypothetical protein
MKKITLIFFFQIAFLAFTNGQDSARLYFRNIIIEIPANRNVLRTSNENVFKESIINLTNEKFFYIKQSCKDDKAEL